jgi:hypothetical protein
VGDAMTPLLIALTPIRDSLCGCSDHQSRIFPAKKYLLQEFHFSWSFCASRDRHFVTELKFPGFTTMIHHLNPYPQFYDFESLKSLQESEK